MNLRIKKFVRGLVAIVLVAVICLALQVVIVPNIVRRAILSSLADIGLSGATLEVRSCSWRGAEFANVELGEDRCACFAAVTAEYSIGSLLRGKLNKIQVTGGQLLVRIRDGKIELGELARIRFKDNERASGPVVDRIELRACVLLVNWHKKQICIPCEGSIINSGSDWTVHDLQLNFQGTPVQMSAAFYSKGKSLVFSLDGRRIDLRALMAALPAEILDLPERWVGQADVKLQGDISIGDGSAALRASVEDCWLKTNLAGFSVDSEQTSCELKIVMESQFRLKDVNGSLDVGAVKLGVERAENVHFDIKKVGDRLLFQGKAQGEGWQLRKISMSLPSEFLGEDGQSNSAEIAWEFAGSVPISVSRKILDKGFDISKLGSVNLSGRASTDWPGLRDFELADGQLTLEPGTLDVARGRAVLHGFSGNLAVRGSYRDKGGGDFVLGDSELRFDSASIGGINAGTTRLSLRGADDQNTVSFMEEDNAPKVRVGLEAYTYGTRLLTSEDSLMADIGGAHLILDANVCSHLDEIDGTLTVDGVRWYSDHPKGMLDLGKASLDFDLQPSAGESQVVEATLTIDQATLLNGKSEPIVALDRKALKPISGSFDLKQRKGEFAWQWPVQKGAILDVIGYVDLSKRQASGSLRAACEGFHLDEEQALAKILADSTSMAIDGSFSFKGDLNWAHGHLTPRITILSSGAAVLGTDYEVMAEGVNGPVTLTNLSPFSTPGNQHLRIETLKLGKFEFHNGLIAFRIEDDPKAVFIERAEWGWLGGRLYAHAVRIDPNQPDIDLRLFAEGLDVGLLLRMAFGEGTIGEGKLYGTIPVRISTSDMADFSLGEGFLHSTTAQGWWKLEDRASDSAVWKALEQQLGQAMKATEQTGNRERILKGLLNFEYDKFKIDFIEQEDGLTARISMKGRSGNIEFEEIVVIIPGIDEDLRSIIVVKSVIGESLRRAVEKVKQ